MSEISEKPVVSPPVWQSAVSLAVVAAICTALVALTYNLTRHRIAANEQSWLEKSLLPAIPGVSYDGDLTSSPLTIPPASGLPGSDAATIYRVLDDGAVVAAVFVVTAPDGFVGPIRLLIGVRPDGSITAVRILEHRETPGIGDLIDQSRTNWVDQFTGRSLTSPITELWKIERDGGEFDQLTGASISPRAVVNAVRETLLYFDENRDSILAPPTVPESDPTR